MARLGEQLPGLVGIVDEQLLHGCRHGVERLEIAGELEITPAALGSNGTFPIDRSAPSTAVELLIIEKGHQPPLARAGGEMHGHGLLDRIIRVRSRRVP